MKTLSSLSGNSARFTYVRLQQRARAMLHPVLQVHAESFRVSVIYRTLTWTTCHDLEGAYVIIRMRAYHTHEGWACTLTASQHNIFDSEKPLTNASCAPDGVRTRGHWGRLTSVGRRATAAARRARSSRARVCAVTVTYCDAVRQ